MDSDHSDTERFKQDVIRLNGRVAALEHDLQEERQIREEFRKLLRKVEDDAHKIEVSLASVVVQVKQTNLLIMLVITGLVGIAFSLWQRIGL